MKSTNNHGVESIVLILPFTPDDFIPRDDAVQIVHNLPAGAFQVIGFLSAQPISVRQAEHMFLLFKRSGAYAPSDLPTTRQQKNRAQRHPRASPRAAGWAAAV